MHLAALRIDQLTGLTAWKRTMVAVREEGGTCKRN